MRRVHLLAVTVLGLTACGGGAASAGNPIVRAAAATESAGSEHVALAATIEANDNARLSRQQLDGGGSFDNTTRQGLEALTLVSSSSWPRPSSHASSSRAVFDGDLLWFSAPNGPAIADGRHWFLFDRKWGLKQAGYDLAAVVGQTPDDLLAQLARVSGAVTTVGRERVEGTLTTHYRAAIDTGKALAGNQLVALMQPTYLPLDVWVDSGGLVRKVELGYSALEPSTPDPTELKIKLTMLFSAFGTPVTIARPSTSDTIPANRYGGN